MGVERRALICHRRAMTTRTPVAGGFFWTAAILIATAWGVAAGNPMKGVPPMMPMATGRPGLIAMRHSTSRPTLSTLALT